MKNTSNSLIAPDNWPQIEAGIAQRMRLLERIMADAYGPQQLLQRCMLPPALVLGHPGYLRALHGVKPVGGTHLHMAAFDLTQRPDGNWWVLNQQCQAPSGLDCLLEPDLSDTCRTLIDHLKLMSPAGADAHLALLTPGPYNASYFEHVNLAHYLGLSLVEGRDLTVRDQHLYLKTLHGLRLVHGLLKRVGDEYLDPLELRPDSTLGVPGLLQVMRAGHVLVANAPGSAFLESPALLDFLPALSQHLLGEALQMHAPPAWQAPAAEVAPSSVMLRVLAVSNGPQSWRVLPYLPIHFKSPLTPAPLVQRQALVTRRAAENLYWLGRYTERCENAIRLARLTLQYLHGEDSSSPPLLNWLSQMAHANTLVLPGTPPATEAPHEFERALISSLGSPEGATSVGYYLRALKMTGSTARERLSQAHWQVIVQAEEQLFARCAEHARSGDYSAQAALQVLNNTSEHMETIISAQTDHMTRDDGGCLLSIGHHIERLIFLASALLRGLQTGSVHTDGGLAAMVALYECTLPLHAQHKQNYDLFALIELLVLSHDNARSLATVTNTMREGLAQLAGSSPEALGALSLQVADPSLWSLTQLCEPQGAESSFWALQDLLLQCTAAAYNVSDAISTTYFSHRSECEQSLGA